MTPTSNQRSRPRPDDNTPYDLDAINAARKRFGLPAVHGRFSKKQRVLSISDPAYTGLQAIAARENITSWRGGSVSGLLEAIGLGLYDLTLASGVTPVQAQPEEEPTT